MLKYYYESKIICSVIISCFYSLESNLQAEPDCELRVDIQGMHIGDRYTLEEIFNTIGV